MHWKRDIGRYLLGSSVISLIGATSPSANAASNEQLEAQLKAMQAQIQQLQRQIEENKATANAARAAAARSEAAESAAAESAAAAQAAASKGGGEKDDLDLKVKWKGAPELSSKDGKFRMKVRGRIETDYNAINQDQSITGQPNVSAAEIRRARLGVEGTLWKDIDYKFEVDFANDETVLKDAFFEYTCWGEDFHLRFGNFKTFNSLEHITSDRFMTFMERAAFVETFGLDRQIGAGALYTQDHFTLTAGIFGPRTAEEEEWLDDVKTGAARVTFAPINDEGHLLHFGGSWRQRVGADDLRDDPIPANDQLFLYRARGADLHLADRFVETPEIFGQDRFWGLEAAFVWGPWSMQGEYAQLRADLGPDIIGVDPTYVGWYVDASWFITGEHRTYKNGEFIRQKVLNPVFDGGHGAWQLAARYDVIQLSDNAATIATCTMCGNQNTWLLGVNWWLNDHTRFMFNFNESTITGGFLDGANENDGAKIRGFGTRAQVDW